MCDLGLICLSTDQRDDALCKGYTGLRRQYGQSHFCIRRGIEAFHYVFFHSKKDRVGVLSLDSESHIESL